MQDATRQGKILSFILMKGKKVVQEKEEEGRKRGGGRGAEGGGEKCLTFFKSIINPLSAPFLNVFMLKLNEIFGTCLFHVTISRQLHLGRRAF